MNLLKNIKDFLLNTKNPFKQSSIKRKFITIFLLMAIFIFLVYFVTFYVFRQAISEYEQLIKNADTANRIPAMYSVMTDDFKNYLVEANDEYDKFQDSIAKIKDLILYIALHTDPSHDKSTAQLRGIFNQLKTIKRKTSAAVDYRRNGELDKANKEFYELSKMSDYLKENIGQYVSKELNYSIASREKIYKKSIILALSSAFLIILVTVTGLLYGIKLSQMTVNAILKIANQDILEEEIHTKYDEEELIHLHNQFAKLQNNIRNYIARLTDSEKRISSILNGMNDCVLTTDENGIILSSNYAVETVFGYEPGYITGKNIDLLISDVNKALINKSEENDSGQIEFNALRAAGSNFPVEISLSQITQDEKKVFILLIHDITQHKEVEQMKNEFVSMVSHELRTPLTSIKGSLELMLSPALGGLSEKTLKMAEISYNNTVRLITLINDILDIEKISAGKMDFYYETIELSSLIKQTIDFNRLYAKQYNINFVINENLPEFMINVDKNRLIQVITNLLSNAAKYSPTGGNVEIDTFLHNNFVRTVIKNYGTPVEEEFKQKIFQKFTQADSSVTRKKGGTGLGLNICKNIIENMHGHIGFDSDEKETVFYFDLPPVKEDLSP